MGHCISVYLMNKSELRDDKINTVLENTKTQDTQDIKWVELKEGILATTHIPNIRSYGRGKTIAKIETDYFGGPGHQTARLFVNNKKEYDNSSEINYCNPINDVLKMMGVCKKNDNDEFDTIGLSNYRHNSAFTNDTN